MSPVTGLAQLPGRIQWCVHKEIVAWSTGTNPGNTIKVVEHKLIVRDCHSFVDSCNITDKVNPRTLKLEIHTGPKLCSIGGNVSKAMLSLFKRCRPGYRAGAFIWEKFHFSVTGPTRPFI